MVKITDQKTKIPHFFLVGKELIDGKKDKFVKDIIFVEDFEYRLNLHR